MNLLNSTETSKELGMTKQAFSKGVKSGRFTPARRDHLGRPLFDLARVKKEYADTRDLAALQDRARMLLPSMRGGRPRKNGEKPAEDSIARRLLKASIDKMIAQTNLSELRLAALQDRYINKNEFDKQRSDLGEAISGVLQVWPAQVLPDLLALKRRGGDEYDFHVLLENRINDLVVDMRKAAGYAV